MGTNLSEENISSAAAVRAGRVGRWLDEEPGRAGLGVYITHAVISGHRIVTHLKLENQGRDGTHLSLSLSLHAVQEGFVISDVCVDVAMEPRQRRRRADWTRRCDTSRLTSS